MEWPETFVFGEAVATQPQLDAYQENFRDWRDRIFWDRLEVCRISGLLGAAHRRFAAAAIRAEILRQALAGWLHRHRVDRSDGAAGDCRKREAKDREQH